LPWIGSGRAHHFPAKTLADGLMAETLRRNSHPLARRRAIRSRQDSGFMRRAGPGDSTIASARRQNLADAYFIVAMHGDIGPGASPK